MTNYGKARWSIRQVADALGISPSTVSRALDDHPRISARTKARVKRAISDIMREPHTPEFSCIGLFMPNDANDAFFSAVIRGVMNLTDGMGIHLLLERLTGDQEELPYAIQRGRVDGAIIAGLPIADALVRNLMGQDVPCVFIGRYLSKDMSPLLNTVVSDNIVGGRLAAEHLKEKGYQRFLVITHHGRWMNPFTDRVEGFRQVMDDPAGIAVVPADYGPHGLAGPALDAIMRAVADGVPIGVFAMTDDIAKALYDALEHLGVDVPSLVGIVGYDGRECAEAGLTTLDVPKGDLGYMAAHLLREVALKRVPTPIQVHLQPKLVVRGSTEECKR